LESSVGRQIRTGRKAALQSGRPKSSLANGSEAEMSFRLTEAAEGDLLRFGHLSRFAMKQPQIELNRKF
jgi:hypothetical protein